MLQKKGYNIKLFSVTFAVESSICWIKKITREKNYQKFGAPCIKGWEYTATLNDAAQIMTK